MFIGKKLQTKMSEVKDKKAVAQEDVAAELERLRAENELLKAQAQDGKVRVLGQVQVQIEDPNTGAVETIAYEVKPGTPKVRLAEGVFMAQDVVDLYNGKVDALRNDGNPVVTQASAKAQISSFAAKGVSWLVRAGAMMVLFVLTLAFTVVPTTDADAQVRAGRWYQFDADTIGNATGFTTAEFLFPYQLSSSTKFGYAIQLRGIAISGSNTFQAIVQESLFNSGDNWINVDTISLTGAGNVFTVGTLTGVRQRIYVTNSGSGSKRLECVVRYREEN